MILGLDTSTAATTAAAGPPGGPFAEARDDPPAGSRPNHASALLALAEEALAAAGAAWENVQRIAVGTGPGGFTGLRIGISTARALAQAAGLPITPVSSLAALAAGVREAAGDQPVVAAIDARRGEVFVAAYREGGELLLPPSVMAPDGLAAWCASAGADLLAAGDGALRYRAAFEAAGCSVPADEDAAHRLSAVHVCRLAAGAGAGTPAAVLPEYLRDPDAVPRLR